MNKLCISTWNLERPTRSGRKNEDIQNVLKKEDSDFIILTETNSCINLSEDYPYHIASQDLSSEAHPFSEGEPGILYQKGENRTSIFSRYPLISALNTRNDNTNACGDFQTPFGVIRVYGTIVGILGRRQPFLDQDFENVITDPVLLSSEVPVIIAGDFNLSFADNY